MQETNKNEEANQLEPINNNERRNRMVGDVYVAKPKTLGLNSRRRNERRSLI